LIYGTKKQEFKMIKTKITWEQVYHRLEEAIKDLPKGSKYYGVPRGGQIIAGMTGFAVDTIEEADFIIDDLIDSGTTLERYEKYKKPFISLIDKRKELQGEWLVFPWEENETETDETVEDNVRRLLQYFGENTNREGLLDTPKRYIKFLKEFLEPKEFNFTSFNSEGADEMIVQTNIPFYSLCEHHIAPFFGVANVAYIPSEKIVGLSKLARTVDLYANRLQNQERVTTQIAERIQKELNPLGVAVNLKAQHLCMNMRGVKKHNTWTTTSKMLGLFKEDGEARNEFFNIINGTK
jgi:GTP cyclohydrolase I